MKARSLLVLTFLTLLLLAGCGKPEDKLVGHYNGKMNLSPQTQTKMKAAGAQGDQLLQGMMGATFGLDMKQDKTYSLTTTMMGQSNVISGSWKLDNNQIVLQMTNPTGNAQGTPSNLTPSEDGKTLTAVNTVDPGSTMVFTKG